MANNKKIGRRTLALLWLGGAAILIGVLIAYEYISVLYLLATLFLVGLLLVVAFADLEGVGRLDDEENARRV